MSDVDNRYRLYTRITPDIVLRGTIFSLFYTFTIIIFIFSPYDSDAEEAWIWLLILILFTCLWFYVQIYVNKGYRVSYDNEAIYLRPDGFRWNLQYRKDRVMRFDDIGEMLTSVGRLNMRPFEFIEIRRKNWDGNERFFLSRAFLHDYDLMELMNFVQSKVPQKVPQDVAEFIAGSQESGRFSD
jgi:hypothetical protein